jgi:hypothetical protein
MTTRWTPNRHPLEDVFEDYAFERLRPLETSDFEEHLLVCEKCQDTLATTDEYIRLMKTAIAAGVGERLPARARSFQFFPQRGMRGHAVAVAMVCLIVLAVLPFWWRPFAGPQTVVLAAYRAGGASAFARCPAGRPVELKIDLSDLPPASQYRVEVVDSAGHRVWLGRTPANLTSGLSAGTYWVRLSTDDGRPLREFGLVASR